MKICLTFLLVIGSLSAELHYVNVTTKNGVVSGTEFSIDGRNISEFLGIPFAEPPVGKLRFLRPQPLLRKWEKPLVADKPPKGCLQIQIPMFQWPKGMEPSYSEDCLYLDVWTPSLRSSSKRSVMVWIHGGGFIIGEGLPMYNGRAIASIGDVVVVTIQYRLDFLGFARLDKDLVPGNNGLWDQQMALRWVHENIAQFGGDPNSVTIFGESAGSTSVSYHLMNPESGKFFKRAILQSGTIFNFWAYKTDTEALEAPYRKSLAEKLLNCSQISIDELLECLQGKSEKEIFSALQRFSVENPFVLGPIIDGHFISQVPEKLAASGQRPSKDVMVGLTEQEGAFFVKHSASNWFAIKNITNGSDHMLSEEFVRFAISSMFAYYPRYPTKISKVAFELIFTKSLSYVDPNDGYLNAVRFSDAMSEIIFDCGSNKFADAMAAGGGKVFFYQFLQRSNLSLVPLTTTWSKSTHGDDIAFTFAIPLVYSFLKSQFTAAELELARRFIKDLTNFAKTGRPHDRNWTPYTLKKKEFYRYGLKSSLEKGGVRTNECPYWERLLPMVNGLRCKTRIVQCDLYSPELGSQRGHG